MRHSLTILQQPVQVHSQTEPTTPTPLKSIQINLLNACAQRCAMCRKYDWPRDILPEETAIGIIHALPEDTTVVLSGGEPVLHPTFPNIARQFVERKLKWALLSNAMVYSDALDSAEYINISVDSASREVYQKVRGVDGFDRMRDTVDRYRVRYPGKPLLLDATISKFNVHEIADLLRFADDRCLEINFELVHTFEDLRPSAAELASAFHAAVDCLALRRVKSNFFIFAQQATYGFLGSSRCTAILHHCVVDADGTVFPCCRSLNDNGHHAGRAVQYALGNVHETPFAELWERAGRTSRPAALVDKAESFCKFCDRYAMYNSFYERYVVGRTTFL